MIDHSAGLHNDEEVSRREASQLLQPCRVLYRQTASQGSHVHTHRARLAHIYGIPRKYIIQFRNEQINVLIARVIASHEDAIQIIYVKGFRI